MAKLDDFLLGLEPGREINIPKNIITEPLRGWKVRVLGLPKEGSKGQIYNGCFHAHDMGDHYCVHKDRVDPDKDPLRHLIKDAPIVLVGAGIAILSIGCLGVARSRKRGQAPLEKDERSLSGASNGT